MYNWRRFVVGSVLAALSWALAVLSVSALDDLMTDNQLGFALCQHNPSAEYLYHKLYNCSRSNSSHEERMVSSACFKKVFKVDAFPANFKEMKIIICDKDNINVTDKMAALDSCQTELGQAKYDVTAAKMTMLRCMSGNLTDDGLHNFLFISSQCLDSNATVSDKFTKWVTCQNSSSSTERRSTVNECSRKVTNDTWDSLKAQQEFYCNNLDKLTQIEACKETYAAANQQETIAYKESLQKCFQADEKSQ